MARAYTLTTELVSAHAGGSVVALDATAVGRSFRAYRERPGPERNRSARAVLAQLRGDHGGMRLVRAEPEPPQIDVLVVDVIGPLEQRAGQHEPSGSWVDGHDAVYERLAAAFEVGDVVLCFDSPGGAVKGGPEMMRRAAEMKAKHGRRCIGFTEGDCCSMALWWAAAVCDEFYVSPDGKAGSVGVRGMLASIAGALAKDGIAVEVFEDPDGKAAGVPERPLDDEARFRAQHEVTLAADMFRAAAAGSAIGQRAGLTPEALIEMRGRSFTGREAVEAGFALDVASLEDVMAYALATAGAGPSTGAAMAGEQTAGAGAEEQPPPPPKDGPKDEKPKDDKAPKDEGSCAKCGKALAEEERYCGRCGMDRVPEDERDDEEPDSDDGRKAKAAKPIVPAAARQGASVAALLGLPANASHPAILTALTDVLRTVDTAALVTGSASQADIRGGLVALAEDVKAAGQVKRDLEAAQAKEMIALALRASALDGSRDGWVADEVNAKGERIGVKLGPKARGYSRDELKAYVEGREKHAAPKRRNPFEADKAAAEKAEAEGGSKGTPTPAQIEAAKKLPAVINAASRPGAPPIEQLAAAHIAAFGTGV